jgi:hypothetical protein
LRAAGIEAEAVFKVNEGRPNIVDLIKTGKIDLVINTPLGRESFYDEKSIRRAPFATTSVHHHAGAAQAAARGIRALIEQGTEVAALQDCIAARLRPRARRPREINRGNFWNIPALTTRTAKTAQSRRTIQRKYLALQQTGLAGMWSLGSPASPCCFPVPRAKRFSRRLKK